MDSLVVSGLFGLCPQSDNNAVVHMRVPSKSHSDPEQGEGSESTVSICFYLLVHFVVFKYFLPRKAFKFF